MIWVADFITSTSSLRLELHHFYFLMTMNVLYNLHLVAIVHSTVIITNGQAKWSSFKILACTDAECTSLTQIDPIKSNISSFHSFLFMQLTDNKSWRWDNKRYLLPTINHIGNNKYITAKLFNMYHVKIRSSPKDDIRWKEKKNSGLDLTWGTNPPTCPLHCCSCVFEFSNFFSILCLLLLFVRGSSMAVRFELYGFLEILIFLLFVAGCC